jgi:hypothetical protein
MAVGKGAWMEQYPGGSLIHFRFHIFHLLGGDHDKKAMRAPWGISPFHPMWGKMLRGFCLSF